jgi:hypothetical protein
MLAKVRIHQFRSELCNSPELFHYSIEIRVLHPRDYLQCQIIGPVGVDLYSPYPLVWKAST